MESIKIINLTKATLSIFLTKISVIRYRGHVEEADLPESVDDRRYRLSEGYRNSSGKFVRVCIDEKMMNDLLNLELMRFTVFSPKWYVQNLCVISQTKSSIFLKENFIPDSTNDYSGNGLNNTVVTEGDKKQAYVTTYERNWKLRETAIKIHGTVCQICGFDFEKSYGAQGKGFIEVHQIKPLSETGEKVVNPETDMICICSNCHRMVHKKKTMF